MASSGLTKMSKRILDRLEMTTMRSKVEEYEGQIFVWDKASFEDAMRAQTSDENVKELSRIWSTD